MFVVLAHDDRSAGLANWAVHPARNAHAEITIAFLYSAALRYPRNSLHATKQDWGAEYAL